MKRSTITTALIILIALTARAQAEGNATVGERVFKKCVACHRVGPGAKNLVGPQLNGLIGRKAGTSEGFSYSQLNLDAGANGLTWNEETLFAYLADPTKFLQAYLTEKGKAELATGKAKMVFKLPSESERRDLIAYLATLPAQ